MANAFGSITIVDMTDVGQFSTVPMSNAGLVIIYDPNALSNNYTPASMTLTPFTLYGGVDYSSNANVSYSWYKRADGAAINYTNPGSATSTSSSITVEYSDFTSISAKSITYYLKATYNISGIGDIIAWGQITISLVTQATNSQDIEINGDSIFKYTYASYGANPTIQGDTSITLTATYTSNVAVHQWYYYQKTVTNGTTTWNWATLPVTGVTISGSTCTISHTAPIFYDNKAKIKVTAHRTDATSTELTSVYDEYEILKLYDGPVGAPGEKSVAMLLSNDDQMIPCDGNGNPAPNATVAFSLASTDIQLFEGNTNITTNNASTGYVVTATPTGVISTNGIQYDSTNQKYTYKVDGWANDNSSTQGYVTFNATSSAGYPSLTKKMSLTKIQTGSDGKTPTVYDLSITPNRVTTDSEGDTVDSVTLTATVISHTVNVNTSAMVNTDVSTSSSDVMYYEWFLNGSTSPVTAASGTGPNGKNVYTISDNTRISSVVCKVRKTNSSGVILDSQSVAFVPEGEKGDTGATGDGVITLSFPQSTDTISLNNDGTLAGAYHLDMPYTVYQGSTPLTAQAVNTVSKGYSFSINGLDFTGGAEGSITFGSTKVEIDIPSGTKVYDSTITGVNAHSLNGQCLIPIDYRGATQTAADGTVTTVSGTILAGFSWNLDIAPANGSSVTISDTWTRYRLTKTNVQPGTGGVTDITKNGTYDKSTIEAAISAASQQDRQKPYYIWSKTFIEYSPSGNASTYAVDYYPADPSDGETPTITSELKYACTNGGSDSDRPGSSSNLWKSTIAAAITQAGISKPYYIWTKNTISYTYSTHTSQNTTATTYSTSYYPEDKVELNLTANATIFQGNITTITITPIITVNGAAHNTLSSGESITWSYVVNGTMTEVNSTSDSNNIYKSGNNLVIKKDAVNGGTSVQCLAVISGQNVYAYLPIEDYTDEFRCELFSTMGDKITNHQGSGFVKCILYRNGIEIDKITAGPTVTSARVSSGSSPHAAVISTTTEMSSSPKPANISDISAIIYSWKYYNINSDGSTTQISDSTYNATGKAVYLDGSMITNRIMIDCEVTVTYATSS